ncbi:MAG: PLDc N-terminal domain-containing protein [Bacteroidota bacterium]
MILIAVLVFLSLILLTVWLFILMDCVNGEFRGNYKFWWILTITFIPILGAGFYVMIGMHRKTENNSPWELIG